MASRSEVIQQYITGHDVLDIAAAWTCVVFQVFPNRHWINEYILHTCLKAIL